MLKAKPPACGLEQSFILHDLPQYVFYEWSGFRPGVCVGPCWLLLRFSPSCHWAVPPGTAAAGCLLPAVTAGITSAEPHWGPWKARAGSGWTLNLYKAHGVSWKTAWIQFALGYTLSAYERCTHVLYKLHIYIIFFSFCWNLKSVLWKNIKSADFDSSHRPDFLLGLLLWWLTIRKSRTEFDT